MEFDEVRHLEREAKNEFENEKKDIKSDVDKRELISIQEQRIIKNKIIDLDVEAKKVMSDS